MLERNNKNPLSTFFPIFCLTVCYFHSEQRGRQSPTSLVSCRDVVAIVAYTIAYTCEREKRNFASVFPKRICSMRVYVCSAWRYLFPSSFYFFFRVLLFLFGGVTHAPPADHTHIAAEFLNKNWHLEFSVFFLGECRSWTIGCCRQGFFHAFGSRTGEKKLRGKGKGKKPHASVLVFQKV